jgi:diphthine synthase
MEVHDLGELIFIGLGLHDGEDISVKGLKAVRAVTEVFAEFYTARLTGTDLIELEKALGRKFKVLTRQEVEDGRIILEAAKNGTVALLCVGDPMSATTHVDLRLRANQSGIKTRIIHGASIMTSAASVLGLQHYKFGRTVTIVFPKENFSPESHYDQISLNLKAGLHTLVLLDIDAEKDALMTANQAMDILEKIEKKKKLGVIRDDTIICVVGRVGSDDPTVKCGFFKDMKKLNFGPPHHSIVIPGNLHFMEAEALVGLADAPKQILITAK